MFVCLFLCFFVPSKLWTLPNESQPNQTKPNQIWPNKIDLSQPKPNQIKANQTKPHQNPSKSKLVLAVRGCYLSVIYIFFDRVVIDSERLFHSDSECSPKLIYNFIFLSFCLFVTSILGLWPNKLNLTKHSTLHHIRPNKNSQVHTQTQKSTYKLTRQYWIWCG